MLSSNKRHQAREVEICMRILPFGERQFVPRVGPEVQLLGVVQRGLETGALARWPNGAYAQVNGDIVQPLNPTQVELAMRSAGMPVVPAPSMPDPKPRIIFKRRRIIQRTSHSVGPPG